MLVVALVGRSLTIVDHSRRRGTLVKILITRLTSFFAATLVKLVIFLYILMTLNVAVDKTLIICEGGVLRRPIHHHLCRALLRVRDRYELLRGLLVAQRCLVCRRHGLLLPRCRLGCLGSLCSGGRPSIVVTLILLGGHLVVDHVPAFDLDVTITDIVGR